MPIFATQLNKIFLEIDMVQLRAIFIRKLHLRRAEHVRQRLLQLNEILIRFIRGDLNIESSLDKMTQVQLEFIFWDKRSSFREFILELDHPSKSWATDCLLYTSPSPRDS